MSKAVRKLIQIWQRFEHPHPALLVTEPACGPI
jgi:hypothetical protein